MRADKIDPPHYEAFLRQTAGRLAQRRSEWLTTVPTSAPSAATVEAVCC
jgi:hypothetical protein